MGDSYDVLSDESESQRRLVHITTPPMPRYKPSRFNAHTTGEDGTLILYNTYSGHSCAFPPIAVARVRPYLSKQGVSGSLTKLGQYLLKKGYIVSSETDEGARWDIRYGMQQYRSDTLQLILLSSEDCNLRCVYCSQEFKRDVMLPRVRDGIRNLVNSRIASLRMLQISWFGGEPLLGYEAIEELAPYFQKLSLDHGVTFYSEITTNGYLLTPERSRKMLDWGIVNYQITIDGSPLEHDRHRPLKGGGATFHQIIDNVVAMKEHRGRFKIHLRVNFDRTTAGKLDPLFSLLRARIGDDDRFQMRFAPVGKWGGANDDELDTCGLREGITTWMELTDQARSTGLKVEEYGRFLDPGSGPCYATRPNSFVIGADGKLMKCTRVLDTDPSNIVGHIHKDGTTEIDDDRLSAWIKPYYRSDPMCNKCFFVPLCQGAKCPLPRVQTGDRPCPSQKTLIRETLQYAWHEKVASREGNLVHISNVQTPS